MENKDSAYHTSGVWVQTAAGSLHARNGAEERLSPLNMKVLLVLLASPQQVVSRQALFDQVWPRQTISDDALTRCISDLRACLSRLLPNKPFIETVPKRGYRWIHSVETSEPAFPNKSAYPNNSAFPKSKPERIATGESIKDRLNSRFMAFALTLLFVALTFYGLFLWLLPQSMQARNIAVLAFSASDPEYHVHAEALREALVRRLVVDSKNTVLANFVLRDAGTELRSLHSRYGVSRIIEGHVFSKNSELTLSLRIVDAQTALLEEVFFIAVADSKAEFNGVIEAVRKHSR